MAEATLSEGEKSRIRYHMGYPQTDPVSSIILGIPASAQPQFLLEGQMNRIPETAMATVRQIMGILDATDQRIIDCQERMSVKSVDGTTMNPDEANMLRKEYSFWVKKLADNLGAPINGFSANYQYGGGGMPLNIPVSN